eukprot:15476451-Alexandrium_andersonii.AAC.1
MYFGRPAMRSILCHSNIKSGLPSWGVEMPRCDSDGPKGPVGRTLRLSRGLNSERPAQSC